MWNTKLTGKEAEIRFRIKKLHSASILLFTVILRQKINLPRAPHRSKGLFVQYLLQEEN